MTPGAVEGRDVHHGSVKSTASWLELGTVVPLHPMPAASLHTGNVATFAVFFCLSVKPDSSQVPRTATCGYLMAHRLPIL